MSDPRVVSLLPSATELVCALGCEELLVGVSHECDFPPAVTRLPVLTASRASFPTASDAIDRDVRAALADALALYTIDEAALERLAPDVIVTQDLCEVCAVSFADVEAAARRVVSPDVSLVSLRPLRLADVWDDLRRLATALGVSDRAEAVLAGWDGRLDRLRDALADVPHRPTVLTLEWLAPPMVGGTWMPELVELAGGRPLVTAPGDHAPTLQPEQLAALDPAPEAVLVKPCGFDLQRGLSELDLIAELLAPLPWPAVRDGAVFLADGSAYFNRSGPRLVDSAELLAACLHPEQLPDLVARYGDAVRRLDLGARRALSLGA